RSRADGSNGHRLTACAQRHLGRFEDAYHLEAVRGVGARLRAGAHTVQEMGALGLGRLGQLQLREVAVARPHREGIPPARELGRAMVALVVDAELLAGVAVVDLHHLAAAHDGEAALLARVEPRQLHLRHHATYRAYGPPVLRRGPSSEGEVEEDD